MIGIDRDFSVHSNVEKLQRKFGDRFKFYQRRFSQLDRVLKDCVDVIIFDLGLSSIQLNNLKRGFSFKSKDRLDMTMGLSEISAEDVINNLSENNLKKIIKVLGEEKEASAIAKNVVKNRIKKKITKVDELENIIEKSKKKIIEKK